jgi:hypothetical protein
MGTWHKDLRTFMITSCWILLRIKNVSVKSCRGNQNTHFMFSNAFWKLCCLWHNVEKHSRARQATDNKIVWHMHTACWITKATDTHSEYVILIPFPLQQWLHTRASMLRYMHTAYLVLKINKVAFIWCIRTQQDTKNKGVSQLLAKCCTHCLLFRHFSISLHTQPTTHSNETYFLWVDFDEQKKGKKINNEEPLLLYSTSRIIRVINWRFRWVVGGHAAEKDIFNWDPL